MLVMKSRKFFLLVMILPGLVPGLSKGQNSEHDNAFIRMGVSQVNITPERPVIMSGYDARKTPSTGVHDSLFASALFFSGEQRKALVITADLIGFPASFVDTVKKMISQKNKTPC